MADDDSMTVREAGRKGVEALREQRGPNAMEEIGGKGGEAVSEKYGRGHFREIGEKGGQKVKRAMEEYEDDA